MIAKAFGGKKLLALQGVSRRFLHVTVDVQLVVGEAPLVNDDVGSHDRVLDVLYEAALQLAICSQAFSRVTCRTWDNMTTVGILDLMVSMGLNFSMLQIPLTTGSIFRANSRRCCRPPS